MPLATVPYNSGYIVPEPADREAVFAELQNAPALPYRHWCWPSEAAVLNHQYADHLARICGSVGLSIYYADQADVDRALEVAQSAGVKIAIQYSPWHYVYNDKDPRGWPATATEELELMSDKFSGLKTMMDVAGYTNEVGMILFDQEILRCDLDDEGNADPDGGRRTDQVVALESKNNLAYEIAKEYFPLVNMLWHSYKAGNPHHTKNQNHDGYASTEMYNGNQRSWQSYALTDFVSKGSKWGCKYFVPAISMAGYYDMRVVAAQPGYVKGVGTEYPVRWTWERAKLMWHDYFRGKAENSAVSLEAYGPTHRLTEGYFWPGVMASQHIGYEWHFLAYIWGAWNHKNWGNDWIDSAVY